MALSVTRLRGVQARRRLQELGGDAAMANQFTPQAVGPLAPGTMQRARGSIDARRTHAYRAQGELEAQRRAEIRDIAEQALRQKDSEFNRWLQEKQQGRMDAAEARNAQLFPGLLRGQELGLKGQEVGLEGQQFNVGRLPVEAGQRDTRFGRELQREDFGFEQAQEEAKRNQSRWATEEQTSAVNLGEARQRAAFNQLSYPEQLAQQRIATQTAAQNATNLRDRNAAEAKLRDIDIQLKEYEAKAAGVVSGDYARSLAEVNQQADRHLATVQELGVDEANLYTFDEKGNKRELSPQGKAFLQNLAQLRLDEPDTDEKELRIKAAKAAGVQSKRSQLEAQVRDLEAQNVEESETKRLRAPAFLTAPTAVRAVLKHRKSDQFKANEQTIKDLRKQIEGTPESPLDKNMTRRGTDFDAHVEMNAQAFEEGTPVEQAVEVVTLNQKLLKDEGDDLTVKQKAAIFKTIPDYALAKGAKRLPEKQQAEMLEDSLKHFAELLEHRKRIAEGTPEGRRRLARAAVSGPDVSPPPRQRPRREDTAWPFGGGSGFGY
jgi:hypothetical protein